MAQVDPLRGRRPAGTPTGWHPRGHSRTVVAMRGTGGGTPEEGQRKCRVVDAYRECPQRGARSRAW